jgi:AcrR family transcriptional regulator
VNLVIAEADVAPMTLYRQFGSKDQLVAATLEQWSTEWLHQLREAVDRFEDDQDTSFERLWSALEGWFLTEEFHGSFVTNVATELRDRPDHPAQKVIKAHRMAMRQLLEDLAKTAGAHDTEVLAGRLQIVIDGAIATATVDGWPTIAGRLHGLADAVLADADSA